MTDTDYAETAYRPQSIPQLPAEVKRSLLGKLWRAGLRLPWARRYQRLEPIELINAGFDSRTNGILVDHQRWMEGHVGVLSKFLLVFTSFDSLPVMAFFLGGGLLTDIFLTLSSPPDWILGLWPFWGGVFAVGLLFRYLINPVVNRNPRWILKDKGDGFFRHTGMVRVYQGGGLYERPFVEFDCYVMNEPGYQGLPNMNMILAHRYEPIQCYLHLVAPGESDTDQFYCAWEALQRYMDVTEPLPDIPALEPYRDQDPSTVEHDRKTGRDPRYWRDMKAEHWHNHLATKHWKRLDKLKWSKQRCLLDDYVDGRGKSAV
ncbi:MAG: hypothetical protein V7629_18650 [Motiliproteus sp.]